MNLCKGGAKVEAARAKIVIGNCNFVNAFNRRHAVTRQVVARVAFCSCLIIKERQECYLVLLTTVFD